MGYFNSPMYLCTAYFLHFTACS